MWKFSLGHIFWPTIYMLKCPMTNIHLELVIKLNFWPKSGIIFIIDVVNYFIVKPMRYVVKPSYGNY